MYPPRAMLWLPDGSSVACVGWARSPAARLRGLLGRPPLQPGEAVVIEPARQVHSFWLTYPIDVIFCARDWRVLERLTLPPARLSPWVLGARYAIELTAGAASRVRPGDRLVVGWRA